MGFSVVTKSSNERRPYSVPTARQRAAQAVEDLRSNINSLYLDQISWEVFSERQRLLWDEIHASGREVEGLVLAALRARLA